MFKKLNIEKSYKFKKIIIIFKKNIKIKFKIKFYKKINSKKIIYLKII